MHTLNCYQEPACRKLRFLANVDPVDVAKALNGLNPGACVHAVLCSRLLLLAAGAQLNGLRPGVPCRLQLFFPTCLRVCGCFVLQRPSW